MILGGATVVTSLDPVRVETVDLHVRDRRIAAAGGGARRDCSGCLVIPGNVCAHTHLYSALARGMPYALEPPEDFVQILQRVWWRLDRALDEDGVRASALVGGMEALLSGTTTLVDHHASPNAIDGALDVVADALASLGARSVLCYETSDRDGPQRARAGLAENRRFAERVQREQPPLVRGMIGAHASFTLSDETLAACADAARAHAVGLHVHAAEDLADERDAVGLYGVRVAERLADAGALDARTLLAHGVHLDDHELALVHAASASVIHNARSNMNNSIGRARVRERSGRASRSAPTGSARTCSRSPGPPTSASARTTAPPARSGRSCVSPRAPGSPRRHSASRSSAGSSPALRQISSSSTTRPRRRSATPASPATGSSASRPAPSAT